MRDADGDTNSFLLGRQHVVGDVDGDGELTLDDAYAIRDAILAEAEYGPSLDVNSDCTIDKSDLKMVTDKLRDEKQTHPVDINLDGVANLDDFAIAVLSLWVACTALTFSFPILNRTLGAHGVFWLYGLICLLGLLVLWRTLPETRGKSLEDIQREFVD